MRKIYFAILMLFASNHYFVHSEEMNADTTRLYQIPGLTVTSTRAIERESPVPFSEITRSEISRSNPVNDLPKLLGETPSVLFFSENGNFIGYTNLTLRGFDQRRISILVNGIPQNDPEDHNFYWINMSDLASGLENIQIQRGAGLSNYGPAAIGGSILLTTRNFAREHSIELSTGIGYQESLSAMHPAGQYGSRFGISATSGIIDNKYAFYARLNRINSFGYRAQSWANLNSYQFGIARFDDNLTTQLNIIGGWQNDGLAYTGLPKQYVKDVDKRRSNYNYWEYDATGENVGWTNERRPQEVEHFSQPQIELLNDWHISDKLQFKSALFYKIGEGYFDYDGTGWTDANSFRLTAENGYPNAADPLNPIIRAFVGNRYGGWIPHIQYNHGGGILTAGFEIRSHRSTHWGKINYALNLPDNFDPNFKFYSYNGVRDIFSVFANEKLSVTDKLMLNLEAQLVYHLYAIENERAGNVYTKYITNAGTTITNGDRIFEVDYLFFNPRIGLNYNFTQEANAYISLARTSREPRMKNLYPASDAFWGKTPLFHADTADDGTTRYDFSKPFVRPEKMLNLELGTSYITDDFFVNVNLYFMDYTDELVKSGQTDLFGSPIDGNAPKTRHLGIELQARKTFELFADYNLITSFNMTYSNNEIIDYDFKTKQGHSISLAGNKIPGFPDFMTYISAGINSRNLFVGLNLRHVGTYKTDSFGDLLKTDERLKQHLKSEYYTDNNFDGYTIMDANIIYTINAKPFFRELKIQATINNLTNLMYASGAIGREFFPAAERNYWLNFTFGL